MVAPSVAELKMEKMSEIPDNAMLIIILNNNNKSHNVRYDTI